MSSRILLRSENDVIWYKIALLCLKFQNFINDDLALFVIKQFFLFIKDYFKSVFKNPFLLHRCRESSKWTLSFMTLRRDLPEKRIIKIKF